MSALFTAPLYGFAVGMSRRPEEDEGGLKLSGWMKAVVYVCAIAGALGALMTLNHLIGGGMSLPHYEWEAIGSSELLWTIPLIIVGALAGWLFCIADASMSHMSERMGDRPVLKPVVAGAILGVCGVALPLTMFSGEAQVEVLDAQWAGMGAILLLAIGLVKIVVTAMCVNMGWRGGHFFPVIFSGIAIGYGMSALTGADPIFCLCVVTAALVGGVMRKPLMAVLLLFLCFPVLAAIPMAVAAFIGSRMPLPRWAIKAEAE